VDPRKPRQSFKILIFFLRLQGMWDPDNGSSRIQLLYATYSIFLRVFFTYLSILTMILYFKDIGNIKVWKLRVS
jgi:hypothetical protein